MGQARSFWGALRITALNPSSNQGDSGTLTIAAGITIEGKGGAIGNASLPLVNQGTIVEDASGGHLVIQGGGWTNAGTIEASGGEAVLMGSWTSTGTIEASGANVVSRGDVDQHRSDRSQRRHDLSASPPAASAPEV